MNVNEYAQLVYFWAGDTEPSADKSGLEKWDKVPAMLDLLSREFGHCTAGQLFGAAGVVLALERTVDKPERVKEWRRTHREVYRRVEALVKLPRDVAEWADFYVGEWLITHDGKSIDMVLDQAANGGDAGHYAVAQLQALEQRSIPFKAALKKARDARRAAMVIHLRA